MFYTEITYSHLEIKETKNITHFPLLKAHPHQRFQCSLAL